MPARLTITHWRPSDVLPPPAVPHLAAPPSSLPSTHSDRPAAAGARSIAIRVGCAPAGCPADAIGHGCAKDRVGVHLVGCLRPEQERTPPMPLDRLIDLLAEAAVRKLSQEREKQEATPDAICLFCPCRLEWPQHFRIVARYIARLLH